MKTSFRWSSIHGLKSSNKTLRRPGVSGQANSYEINTTPVSMQKATPMKRLTTLLLILSTCTGCQSFLHELQPHRLWRLNYTDAPGRSDGSFLSIDDPPDEPIVLTTDTSAP